MTFEELKLKVQKKRDIISKHNDQLNKLLEKCTHDETFTKEYYFDGSYFDKASTTYVVSCSLCGKNISDSTKQHSWYG